MTAVAPASRIGTDLAERLRGLLRDIVGRTDLRLVVLAMSKDENPKTTMLVFVARERHPSFVVKVARSAVASAAVHQEGTALSRVHALDPTLLGNTVPRLVDLRAWPDGAVLVTTACLGRPMSVPYHQWRHTASPTLVGRDFGDAATWLRGLSALAIPGRLSPGRPRREVTLESGGIPDRIRRRWPGDPVALEVAAWARERDLRLTQDHRSVVHGDFWCGNVLRSGQRISGVVDWEHSGWGDPLRDRVRFALSYALYLDRHTPRGGRVVGHPGLVAGRWGDPVRHAVLADAWFPAMVRDFVAEGLAATRRPRELWRDALVLGLVEIAALSDHADFARCHLDLAAELGRCR